jgi:hypothetical protein
MVDFPEGYGFEPGGKAKLMQASFLVDIGVFVRRVNEWDVKSRRRSPYVFNSIGYIRKDNNDGSLRGVLHYRTGEPPIPHITGALQQIVTAMCTLHKLRGNLR